MKIFNNFKSSLLMFFIMLAFGYYLGVAISAVIDQKINNITIRMPKPKNNIIIHVDQKPTKVNIKSNNKKQENFINYKENAIKPKEKKVNKIKTFKKEVFNSYPNNPTQKMRQKYYKQSKSDNMAKNYSKLYKTYRKDELNNSTELIPYNQEEVTNGFINIDKNGKPFDPANILKENKVMPQKWADLLNKKKNSNKWDTLPTRDKLCPDFKCQRNYMTCTSNHVAKISKK